MGGYDARDQFPRIKNWIEDVRKECNPYYDEAHVFVDKIAKLAHKDLQEKL